MIVAASRTGAQAGDPDGSRRGLLCPRPGPSGRISTFRNGRRSTDWDTLSGLIGAAGAGNASWGAALTLSSAFLTSLTGPMPTRGRAAGGGSIPATAFGGRPRRFGAVARSPSALFVGRRAFAVASGSSASGSVFGGGALAAVSVSRALVAGRSMSAPSTRAASRRSPLLTPSAWRSPAGSAIQPS